MPGTLEGSEHLGIVGPQTSDFAEIHSVVADERMSRSSAVYVRGVSTWSTPERSEPPSNPLDERAALEHRLQYQRTTLLMKCGGLTPEQLAQRSVTPSTMSLLGLVRHMSGVEAWFHSYDGQPDHKFFWNYFPGESDGFDGVDAAHADADLASYQASVTRWRSAVRERGLDEAIPGEDFTLRWIYLHMIEEYARHNGHADLLRERIDGATGE